jgi:TP901 family phage tail tape measure protein
MAVDLQRTIEIIFAGVDNVGPTVQSVGRSLDELQGKVAGVTGPMADWTKTILAAETALVGVGLAMAGVAVNQAGEFQTSVKEIGTLFNATQDQVKGLGDEILDYAVVSTSSIEEINQAVYKAISTGTDYADAVKLVADAEILATAGRANLADTTDLLTSSLNAYGDGVQQAADYSDALFAAVQTGNTNLPELATNLGKITGVASAAGVPFDDLVATLSALTITTGNTAESSTKLRALLSELIKPSDDLKVALGGTTLAGDGLQAVMEVLQAKTGGSAEEMSKLFGSSRALQAALALANDNSGAFAAALEAQANRAGLAAAANEELGKSFESINQNLANSIQAAFIGAGEPLLDNYGEIVTELSNLFKTVSFEFRGDAFNDLYDGVDGATERITEALSGIAEALPAALEQIDFDVLLSSFDKLGISIGSLFGDLDLTNADDLATVIQTIVDGVAALTNVAAGAVDGLGPFIRTIATLIDEINKGDEGIQNFAGQILGFATGIDALLPAMGGLGNVLATVGGGLAVLGGAKQAGLAISSLTKLTAVLSNPVTGLLAVFGAAAYALVDFTEGVSRLNAKIEESKRVDELWSQASGMTETWGDMIVKAKALGGDVAYLADVFEETYGITIEQAEGYNSVSEAMDGVSKKAQELAGAERQVAEERARSRMESQIAALEEQDRAQRQEEYKQTILDQVEAYRSLTSEQYNQLTVTERESYAKALLLADQRGWLAELDNEKDVRSEVADEQRKQEVELKKEVALRKEAKEELLAQTQQLYDFQLALEEIASNERIRGMELTFELDIEQMRQNAETARAIISSIGETINSTGETITGLAELLTGFSSTSSSGYREIMEIIQNEETRRDEAIEMQQEITRAQVEQMDAQTALLRQRADAYARGDAAITINGEGLQPHLEAFMWEILETLQVRVNAEGHAMLLGV